MPTSVLLAVLAAAGLLALAPALVHRYDATERQFAERMFSTARVISRRRRRRTVPGKRPVNPPRSVLAAPPVDPPAAHRSRSGSRRAAGPARARGRSRPSGPPMTAEQRRRWWRYRRRRVLLALLVLTLVEIVGLLTIGPGFWYGLGVSALILGLYVVHLRNLALAERRLRRLAARRIAIARRHALEDARERARERAARLAELAAREQALRQAQEREARAREAARLAELAWESQVEDDLLDGTTGRRGLRGRPYQARAVNL